MDYYKIGQRIRKVRKAHGLSQEELAEKVSISTTHMSHIETGNTKLSLPVFVDIAAALEVRTDDLLDNPTTATTSTSLDEISVSTPSVWSLSGNKMNLYLFLVFKMPVLYTIKL